MTCSQIVLLTHGDWASELIASAKMILGSINRVVSVPLEPSETLLDYREKVSDQLGDTAGSTLILTDLFGGTPSNVAAMICQNTGAVALSGLCLPMLLEACVQLQSDGVVDPQSVLAAGQNACKNIMSELHGFMEKREEQ